MKKVLCGATLACFLLVMTSCNSGPRRLSRSWDDWTNQKYSEDSWIHGALLQDILPVYPIVGFLAQVGDWIAVNPYYFWTKDVQDRTGTVFTHKAASGDKAVSGSGL